jgi:hydroxylamine reductase (hybrid-cluster protein)
MCNRYSKKYGYICENCFSELLNSSMNTKEFMGSIKGDFEIENRYEKLNAEFRSTEEF